MAANPHIPQAEDMDVVARDIKRALGQHPLALFAVDAGGYKVVSPLEEALHGYGIGTVTIALAQSDDTREGYRPVLGIKKDPRSRESLIVEPQDIGKLEVAHALVVDDDTHYGGSSVGGMFYPLEEAGSFGFDQPDFGGLFLFVDYDLLNVAHFARERRGGERRDIRKLMQWLGPQAYGELEKSGRIALIGEYPARQRRELFPPVHISLLKAHDPPKPLYRRSRKVLEDVYNATDYLRRGLRVKRPLDRVVKGLKNLTLL